MNVLPFFMGARSAPSIEDLFATTLYTGDGSTQTINNGIDLAGDGGLVWIKQRTSLPTATGHYLLDTLRGGSSALSSNTTNAAVAGAADVSFASTGFSLLQGGGNSNGSGGAYASWTFRRAPKFFDVVLSTGDGNATQVINHNLSTAPGMVIGKRYDDASSWFVYHISLGNNVLILNSTGAVSSVSNGAPWTDSTFTIVNADLGFNGSGSDIVWYFFAHDTSASGIVQCVSVTTDGSGNASYNHGWAEGVQFAMLKCTTTTGDWEMFDTARSPSWTTDLRLRPNLLNAEDTVTRLSDTGGTVSFTNLSASQTYIASLIRAPS